MTTNVKAVRELAKINHPASGVYISGKCESDLSGVTLTDGSTLSFSFDDVLAKKTELQADYEAKQYQRDRAVAYPSIQDVVVALAEKEEGNDAMWQEITAQRAKVKSDNPKPE